MYSIEIYKIQVHVKQTYILNIYISNERKKQEKEKRMRGWSVMSYLIALLQHLKPPDRIIRM